MSTEFARHPMVERQIRTWDVNDTDVLATLVAHSYTQFVATMYADLAYADTDFARCGRLFAVVGESRAISAVYSTVASRDEWQFANIFETDAWELINAPQKPQFSFLSETTSRAEASNDYLSSRKCRETGRSKQND